MDADVPEGGSNRRLNRAVAITVVLFSVFMGVSHIKDDNLVQAMQQAKADSVDRWNEYQAERTKLHVSEAARQEIALIGPQSVDKAAAARALAQYDSDIAKYRAEAPKVKQDAKDNEALYDALNVHDDQFDASDALLTIAVSLSAVSALVEMWTLLAGGWIFGTFGILMGIAGFAGWSLHPDFLARALS
jgi:hypothetical protein